MFIFKNAIRCILRSKSRSVLLGIISLVIAISACLGLSIRQAAESAKAETLAGMSITATISFDRQSMMGNMGRPQNGSQGGFDKEQFEAMMGGASSLTLEEYETYAQAASVQNFYYTLTVSVDGNEDFSPVTTSSESSGSSAGTSFGGFGGGGFGGGKNPDGMFGGFGADGDFSIVGYSSYAAMTDFINSTATVTSGSAFEEETEEYQCMISLELATYNNNLAVGDTITIVNPNAETETYTLTIVGIYESDAGNDFSMSVFGSGQDPANQIYMSANAVAKLIAASESVSTTVKDDNGRESETAMMESLTATYVFADVESYQRFDAEARALGLEDSYVINSSDLTEFENSLTPLKTLSTMAGWFLLVILIIGAVILVVLNILNIRERKYEIGVLTAMGMKKWKVALQFMAEILVVTMIAIFLGAGIGAVSSVPVTNALLANQAASQNDRADRLEQNFGRPDGFDFGGFGGGFGGGSGSRPGMPGGNREDMGKNPFTNYITEVNSAMNLTVVLQMIGIGLLLTLVAGAVAILFIMRYNPLKILSNRD